MPLKEDEVMEQYVGWCMSQTAGWFSQAEVRAFANLMIRAHHGAEISREVDNLVRIGEGMPLAIEQNLNSAYLSAMLVYADVILREAGYKGHVKFLIMTIEGEELLIP